MMIPFNIKERKRKKLRTPTAKITTEESPIRRAKISCTMAVIILKRKNMGR